MDLSVLLLWGTTLKTTLRDLLPIFLHPDYRIPTCYVKCFILWDSATCLWRVLLRPLPGLFFRMNHRVQSSVLQGLHWPSMTTYFQSFSTPSRSQRPAPDWWIILPNFGFHLTFTPNSSSHRPWTTRWRLL